jgi:ABC-type nitrate/sulfonate/bicarbonate transport system ATPase subunit
VTTALEQVGLAADAARRYPHQLPQGMVGMQRSIRILKYHLHVAPQLALKAGARRNGLAFSLIGASGCGKSTILRVLAGLQREWRGSVDLLGQARKLAAETAVFAPNVTCKS